jgi:hypothetical protein
MLSKLVHEHRHYGRRELIHAIVIVAELREIALGLVIDYNAGFVADHFHARIANGRQAVRNHRQASDAKSHRAHRRIIV